MKILWQTAFAFGVLFLVMRLLGKREVARGTFWQFSSAIALGSMAADLALDGVHGIWVKAGTMLLWGGITFAFGLMTLNNRWFRGLVDSKPTVVVHNGKILEQAMASERFHLEGLMEAMRQKQVTSMSDVEFAILETSGKVSIIKKSQKQPVTPADLNIPTPYVGLSTELVIDGKLIAQNLQQVGLSEEWLQQELLLRGIGDYRQVTLASLDSQGRLYVDLRHDPLGRYAHRPGDMGR